MGDSTSNKIMALVGSVLMIGGIVFGSFQVWSYMEDQRRLFEDQKEHSAAQTAKLTAAVNLLMAEVGSFSKKEAERDATWLRIEQGEHKAHAERVGEVRKDQSRILQQLSSIESNTDTLVSQHERRFEEVERGQQDVVNQLRDSALVMMSVISRLSKDLGMYQGLHQIEGSHGDDD